MNLVVVSHKVCWPSRDVASGYVTDGGFPLQMHYLSELFSKTTLVVPCGKESMANGLTALSGTHLAVEPLSLPEGVGFARKIGFIGWLVKNGPTIWKQVKEADAVHAPIPGDVGTIGLVFALLLRKPLYVRHCGNWLKPRTVAERCWKFGMEMLAGKRNAMLATGGGPEPPSDRNRNIDWIFATSLKEAELAAMRMKQLDPAKPRLVIACRQEERKGTDVVINSLPQILQAFPGAELIIAGDGSQLEKLKALASECGVQTHVTFLGKLSQREVIELFRSCDLFCFPTSASEGFPKVVLEAMAAGLPVITTRVSVLPQLLSQGGGVLLDSTDPQELATTVVRVLSDADEYANLSRSAIENARRYTLENWRDRIGEFLNRSWQTGGELPSVGKKSAVGRV